MSNDREEQPSRNLEQLWISTGATEELLQALLAEDNAELWRAYCSVLRKRPLKPSGIIPEATPFRAAELRYELLRFFTGDSPSALHVLYAESDRRNVRNIHAGLLSCLKSFLEFTESRASSPRNKVTNGEEECGTITFFSPKKTRIALFEYFLRRYDLGCAWKALNTGNGCNSRVGKFWNSLNPLTSLGFLAFSLALGEHYCWSVVQRLVAVSVGYCLSVLLLTLFSSATRKSPLVAVQVLIPRLAGTSVVGLLFLFSATDLRATLVNLSARQAYLFIGVVALFSFAYLLLEMERRVSMPLALRKYCWRGMVILGIASLHAASAALLLFLGSGQLCLKSWLTMTAAITGIGLTLNIIWADDPVTTPL